MIERVDRLEAFVGPGVYVVEPRPDATGKERPPQTITVGPNAGFISPLAMDHVLSGEEYAAAALSLPDGSQQPWRARNSVLDEQLRGIFTLPPGTESGEHHNLTGTVDLAQLWRLRTHMLRHREIRQTQAQRNVRIGSNILALATPDLVYLAGHLAKNMEHGVLGDGEMVAAYNEHHPVTPVTHLELIAHPNQPQQLLTFKRVYIPMSHGGPGRRKRSEAPARAARPAFRPRFA